MTNESILNTVQNQYGAVARSGLSNESAAVRSVAQAFGYTPEELASLPPQANMGLSCGNPVALAGLREGEIVLDLGCGGGLDVLLAASRVGPTGKAIGIDMTPEMIERSRTGAAQVGASNVEFHLAQIDQLPIPDASVDCVISNCVINLVPDKSKAFREIFRVLKPGGRVAISDIALKQTLPPEVAADLKAYVGCIAGAISILEYEQHLRAAGFESVVVTDPGADLNVYAQASSGGCCSTNSTCCAPVADSTCDTTADTTALHDGLAQVMRQFDANAYAASVRVHALKPASDVPVASDEDAKVETMKTIQVYDKPMCCSTGICGPQVDPVLPRFAADLDWLKSRGHQVERYNLGQQPQAFIQNAEVHRLLATEGTDCLPLVILNGQVVSQRLYPTREMLDCWSQSSVPTETSSSMVQDRQCCSVQKSC